MTNYQKKPLYRKVNTIARHCHHNFGGDYKDERNTKAEKNSEATHSSMRKNVKRGLDYSPLFKFLLSKVGQNWTAIHKEAVSRLDQESPIWWIVAKSEDEKTNIVKVGENSYFNGLYIDENNLLQKVNPNAIPNDVAIYCTCCTYSLNGIPIITKPKKPEIVTV